MCIQKSYSALVRNPISWFAPFPQPHLLPTLSGPRWDDCFSTTDSDHQFLLSCGLICRVREGCTEGFLFVVH